MYKGNKTVQISYADEKFAKAQRLNSWAGKQLGRFDKVVAYGPDDIDDAFYEKNKTILSMPRGAGLWLWKPYIIYRQLEQLNDGDFLFYCDSGSFMLKNCKYIFDTMNNTDIWASDLPLIEEQWTKPYVFKHFGIQESVEIKNSNQIQAGFIGIRKSKRSVEFVEHWLKSCCNPNLLLPILDDEERGNCISHREDQAIFSVLCKLHGIRPHKDPTQFGKFPDLYQRDGAAFKVPVHVEDNYPVLINLHRSKGSFRPIFKQLFFAMVPKSVLLVYRKIRHIIN